MSNVRKLLWSILSLWLSLLVGSTLLAAAPPPHPVRFDRYGDPLPRGAVARLGSLRLRHSSQITFLAVPPEGKSIVVMSDYGPLVVWDLRTGRPVRSWSDIGLRSDRLALSPDGKTLFACGGGWTDAVAGITPVRSWDVRTGKQLARLSHGPADVDFLGVSRDGKSLAAFGNGAIAVWDLATGQQRRLKVSPPFSSTTVGGLAVSADGRTLVMRREQTVQLLDLTTGKERLLGRHEGFVYNAAISPDGKWVASSSADRTVRLWDISGKHPARVFRHEGNVWSVAFSPDGKRLASIESSPSVVHVWDVQTGRRLRRLPHQGRVNALVFLPGGEDLVTGGQDCRVRIWNLASGRERFPSEGSGPVQRTPVFSPDGAQVAVGTDTSIEIWNVKERHLRWALQVEELASELAWQPDSKRLHALRRRRTNGAWEQHLLDLEATTGKVRRAIRLGGDEFISSLAVSPDGRWFAVGGAHAPLRLFDHATGKESFHDPEPTPSRGFGNDTMRTWRVRSLAFSPDGRLLAECNGEKRLLRLWDIQGKTCTRKIRLAEGFPDLSVFSPDGSLLGVVSTSGKIQLIETETGEPICELSGSGFRARSVAFSREGRFLVADGILATSLPAQRIRVWDLASGEQVAEWQGAHPAVSPDGRWLATVEEYGTTLVWDARQIFKTPNRVTSDDELVRFWDELLSPDKITAYRAAWRLVSRPARAVLFLRARLLALRWPEGPKVAELVRRLDSDAFADRQDAESTLERMGTASVSFLRYQLTCKPSLEAHRRIERVLARMAHLKVPAKRRRAEHAVRVLELIGTPAARSVLQELAGPGSLAGVQLEAQAALARLDLRVTSRKP